MSFEIRWTVAQKVFFFFHFAIFPMKKAKIAFFSLFALLFWVKSASAQAVPKSCVVTEKATGRSDTLRPGTPLRVEVANSGTTSIYTRPLLFWHADTLALGPSGKRPQVFLPIKSVQSVKWRLAEKANARQQKIGGSVAMAAGLVLVVTGVIVDLNDNGLYSLEDEPSNPRGGTIAAFGIAVGITGAVVLISSGKRSRTANHPSSGWLISPLRQR